MAANADSVVVDLVANVEGFNKNVTDASKNFDQSMNAIEQSSGKAERAHGRLTLAANNNRIAMLEFQKVSRGVTDQIAAGAPLTQILTEHLGELGEAAELSGSSMGAFGKLLQGPWGLAITLGASLLATLILKHKEEGDTVEGLIGKLKEHAEKTRLSEEADRIWADTLGALIERQKEHNAQLEKRLQIQPLVDQAELAAAQKDQGSLQQQIAKQKERITNLQNQLKQAEAEPIIAGDPGETSASAFAHAASVSRAQELVDQAKQDLATLKASLADAGKRITNAQITVGQTEGKALADLSAAAALFGQKYEGVISQIIRDNPKLGASAAQIEAVGQSLISAANDAASAGVDFKSVANDAVIRLDKQLDTGKISVRTYATEIAKLTKTLNDMTEAAKEAAKHKIDPISQFKQAVIGAEGVGPNQAGSPAAGIGQFMPATFEHYYRQAYGNPGNLANSDIDKLRNDRTVVAGVIEVAAKDYAEKLKAAGVQITAGALYAFHMLSAGTSGKVAIDLLTAPGGTSARSIVGNKAVAQNGNIFTGTVDQARAELAKRIGDSSTAVSAGAVAIAQEQQREKEAERKYGDAVATVESQILSARKELGLSAQETADIETAAAKVAHDRYEADVKQLAAEGKIRGDVTALLKKNDDLEKARLTVIQARLQAEKFAEQQEATSRAEAITSASFSIQEQLLQSQEGLARTAGERRAIEQRLLDLQYTQEKTELQSVIANAARLKTEADLLKTTEAIKAARDAEAQAAIARLKLGTLDQRHADATAGNNLQNASPLRAYLDDIPDTAKRIDQALEQVAANGLQNFVDGIADAVVHFKSLGDVGLAALQGLEADLIKLALRLIIANTLGKLFGDSFKSGGDSAAKAAADAAAKVAAVAAQQLVLQAIQTSAGAAAAAASIAEAAAVGAAWAPAAAAAALATLGGNAAPAAAALVATNALSTVLALPRALGGPIFGPGGPTDDRIMVAASNGEYMIRAASAQRLGPGVLDHLNNTGELPAFANGGSISPLNVSAAAPGSRSGFSPSDIRQLEGIVGRAIAAMPDVNLYPTIDSGDVLKRGIDTTHGSRAVLAHVTDNSSRYKAVLGRPGA